MVIIVGVRERECYRSCDCKAVVKLLVPLRRLRSARSLKLQPIAEMLRHLARKVHFPTSSEVREVIYSARKTNTVSLPRFIVVRRGFVHDTALLPPLQEGGGGWGNTCWIAW